MTGKAGIRVSTLTGSYGEFNHYNHYNADGTPAWKTNNNKKCGKKTPVPVANQAHNTKVAGIRVSTFTGLYGKFNHYNHYNADGTPAWKTDNYKYNEYIYNSN